MKKMEKKSFSMGILALVLVFGICFAGCKTVSYYDLGEVSEENYALIQVNQVRNTEYYYGEGDIIAASHSNVSEYRIVDFVTIDGQGNEKEWKAPSDFGYNFIYVRVTPGEHTFTLYFIRDGKRIPTSITYDCKAGKGYSFVLLATTYQTAIHTGINFPTRAVIILEEYDINEKGTFDVLQVPKEIARKAEVHDGFNDGIEMEILLVN